MTQPPEPSSASRAQDRARSRAHDRVLARWLWTGHVRRWMPLIGLAILGMTIDGSMTGALSALLKPMFDEVLVAGNSGMLTWVALGFAATFVIRAFTALTYRTIMAYVAERVGATLQEQLARHLMTLDQSFHHNHSPGHLIDRVRGDTLEVNAVIERVIPAAVRDFVAIIALGGVALWTDWRWTLVALIGVPLLVLPAGLIQRLVRRTGVRARDASAAASTRLDEIFHGVQTIQRTGIEEHEGNRLARVLRRFVKARVWVAAGQAAMGSMSDLVAALGFALVLTFAGAQIVAGERTVGEFMTFIAAIALLFDPLRRMGGTAGAWQNALASLDRIHRLLAEQPRIRQPQGPLAPLPAPGAETIRFDDVTFAYDGEPVLRGLTLVAEAGKTTALVGPSGAGKSTVFTLLTRLADPQQGRVLIGGEDIARMDLRGLRDLFSVVAQDSALFDETLRDNVLMGAPDVSEERLQQAIRAAHVDEFLPSLTEGLDTRVGPRGSALSGGQRQRVSIARALLRESPVLLLDEATSALDARSESLVQEALDKLSSGRTTLVIAHRLSTIRHADKIVVMEAGRVVEEGDHATLMARGGTYARLHALQFNE